MKYKNYYFVFMICVLCISCNNENELKNDLEKANLKGSVKSTTENTYQAIEKFGEIVKGELITNEIFNKHNTIIKYNLKGYRLEDNRVFPTKFRYNDKNLLIEEYEYISKVKIFHKYDDGGLELELNNFYKDTLVQRIKYKYDNMGNKVEINSYDYSGKLSYKIKQVFKEKNVIQSKEYDEDGLLSSTNKYKYNNNGNIIENIVLDSNNKVTNKYNSKYDENNNLIEWRVFIDNDIRNELTTYKYSYLKFDSNKNWTEKIEYENDIPTKITLRTIEYY
jgi:hypothetical protein